VIASVRGNVLHAGLDRVVVEVGGVGMLVHTTPGTAASVRRGQEAALSTTLVVREDSLTLYGFGSDDERDMFEQVQTVSGVGPRLALAMLSVMPPDRIRAAISGSDVTALTKVPGIGKKGAERMVLELRDKIGAPSGTGGVAALAAAAAPAWREQVTEALVGLGWSAKQAEDAVKRVADGAGLNGAGVDGAGGSAAAPNVSEMLRAALRELGR
jgi:Holliday junction DNA helicase RuvA